jgi:hypothetical protein
VAGPRPLFHGRLSDDGLAYTDDKINEWLDNHPEVARSA